MNCYILSGLPGSGKSTYCQDKNAVVVSADHFFMSGGVYNFDIKRIGDAHKKCFKDFIHAFNSGKDIIVDNTNTTLLEINPYYVAASAFGYKVFLVRFPCTVEDSVKRNVHNVPEKTIIRMNENINRLSIPAHWEITQIIVGEVGE